jgi:peptidoglycan/LPS O-acetylase OafA/YrhL
VLSGFLLYRPWSRWALSRSTHPRVGVFARRRLLRIFPAYLLVMLAFAVMYPASQPNGWDGWLRAFTLTGTLAGDGLRPGLEQTWSLGTELTWYVALPFLGLFAGLIARRLPGRRGGWTVAGLLALALPVSVLWRIWVAANADTLTQKFTWNFWLPGFLVCFAAGAAVSHFLEGERAGLVDLSRIRGWFSRTWLAVLLMVVAAAIGTSPLGGPVEYVPASFRERSIRFACATLLAVLLLLACALSRPDSLLVRFMSTRFMVATGRWSYGIYLWHLPVIVLIEDEFVHRTGVGGFFLWMTTIFAVTIPLGAATYAWVEKPAIAWSKRTRSRA